MRVTSREKNRSLAIRQGSRRLWLLVRPGLARVVESRHELPHARLAAAREDLGELGVGQASLVEEVCEAVGANLSGEGVPPRVTVEVGSRALVRAPHVVGAGVGEEVSADKARGAAGYVCEADNNAGGVAEAIERFVLA